MKITDLAIVDGLVTLEPQMFNRLDESDQQFVRSALDEHGLPLRATNVITFMVTGSRTFVWDAETEREREVFTLDRLRPFSAVVFFHRLRQGVAA